MNDSARLLLAAMLGPFALGLLLLFLNSGEDARVALDPGPHHEVAPASALESVLATPPLPAIEPSEDPAPKRAESAIAVVEASTKPSGSDPSARIASGWILDPYGRPVVGARVSSWQSTGLARSLNPEHATVTGSDGRFELRLNEHSSSSFVVEHPDYLAWSGQLDADLAATIELEAPHRIRGRVLDARGQAARGSLVSYETQGLRPTRRRVHVDRFGDFEIDGLRPGTLSVSVSGPHGSIPSTEIQVDEEVPALLQLGPTRRIEVSVAGAQGAPLADVRVVLLPRGEPRALESARSSRSGQVVFPAASTGPLSLSAEHSNQRFEAIDVPEGDCQVTLRPLPSGSLVLCSAADGALLVDLVPRDSNEGRDLRLIVPAGAELTCSPLAPGEWTARWTLLPEGGQQPGSLDALVGEDVRILDGQETRLTMTAPACAGIRGSLTRTEARYCAVELQRWNESAILARCAIGSDGSFRFDGLSPGTYGLTLCAEGGGRWTQARVVTLRAGETLPVSLVPFGSTCTILASDADGQPLTRARAWLRNSRAPFAGGTRFDTQGLTVHSAVLPAATADEAGLIQIELFTPDKQLLVIDAPGHEPVEIEIAQDSIRVDAFLSKR